MRAFDTETELIRPDCLAPRLVCVTGDAGEIFLWKDARPFVEALLRGDVVGQNIAYDMAVIAVQWPDLMPAIFRAYRDGRVHDTKLRQILLDIANGDFRFRVVDGKTEKVSYALSDLASRHLGVYLSKGGDTWRLRYAELREMPVADWPAEARDYAILDATITRRVADAQEALRFSSEGHDLLFDGPAQSRAAWWIHLMACWGMIVDPEKSHLLEAETRKERDDVAARLLAAGLLRTEKTGLVRNTKAAAARMIEACLALDRAPRPTAGGGICLDEEACEDSGDELLQDYAAYSALSNLLAKDFTRKLDKTGQEKASLARSRIHANFQPLVANGRTACRGFNLQNMRTGGGTRGCFRPADGMVFLVCDLAVAELRAVAQCCLWMFGESRLAEAINAGRDPHCMLTAVRLALPYEHVLEAYSDGDKTICAARQLDKRSNFGYWGGMGPKTLGRQIKKFSGQEVPLDVLYEMKSAWLATWPEANRYLALHGEAVKHGPVAIEQYVSKRLRRIEGPTAYSEANNTRFSGLVADACKAAGFALAEEMYVGEGVLRGSRIVNFAHDEFVIEVPEELGHECAERAKAIILKEAGAYMPDVPPATTPILSRTWSKEAKQVVLDGRLVPWEKEA